MSISFDRKPFKQRHIGCDGTGKKTMLEVINSHSLDELMAETIPEQIRLSDAMEIGGALDEEEYLDEFRSMISQNKIYRSFIGMGYYDTITPNVIKRNVLENPGWYTPYTPYQAEIAQGRLEALLNFQTMVSDLTGMELANASLLDEGTAAAEAVTMLYGKRKGHRKKTGNTLFISEQCFPQTIEVIKGRLEPLDINVEVGDHKNIDVTEEHYFALLLQYPANNGNVYDYTDLIAAAAEHKVTSIVAADLLSLTMLKAPGAMGADVVVGSSQRFGVPMGYGGPHAAYFATREKYKRQIPGRIIGVTQDSEGNPALRMALQTREQHIRREKATSNICTAQVLLAVMAGLYGVYHGPEGLRKIAERIHGLAELTRRGLEEMDVKITNDTFFDTLTTHLDSTEQVSKVREAALDKEINLRYYGDTSIGISFDEAKQRDDVEDILDIFAAALGKQNNFLVKEASENVETQIPERLSRPVDYLDHPVFNNFHSEHEMLRYLKRLENRDLSLVHSMISLGSCTMKLNATAEMIPLTWPEVGNVHPFAPKDQAEGYHRLFEELEQQLAEITGYEAVSLQPNSGASGELAGLLTIRRYHQSRGEGDRDITIVPESAHGTNPASAVMSGTKVVVTECDERGSIDIEDLRANVEKYRDRIAAIMITYPSTHGVFEKNIKEICKEVHEAGGLVYMDGANMNAQIGLTTPAAVGADVCHLNLHKTFCIPHGGGGPGVGPIGVNEKLKPFLPGHNLVPTGGENGINAVASAPWGSASILPISYGYIKMMGSEGLKEASEVAILNANYIKERLKGHYNILYSGKKGRVAHEFILDLRPFRESADITVADVAKRLMDYGFHSPTMSWPVPGTLMVEPTESESKEELDRFCEAMISIRKEIAEIEDGLADKEDNLLKNAPHTQRVVIAEEWNHPYSRERAAFPVDWVRFQKFWPSVSRVDDAYGDRNLMCSCIPIHEYAEGQEPVAVQ